MNLFDPPPPGERVEDELTGPSTTDDDRAAAALEAAAANIGRPFHKGCGLRTDRENVGHGRYGDLKYRCPEHGLVAWDETTYDPEKA